MHIVKLTLIPDDEGTPTLSFDYLTYSAPEDVVIQAGMFFIDDTSTAITYASGANNSIPHNGPGNENFLLTTHYLPKDATASLNLLVSNL